jgi:hypothetical protein
MMFIRCPIAQIVNVQIDYPFLLRPLHHALAQGSATDFRKQCDNVDSHRKENVGRPPSNTETVAAVYACRNPKGWRSRDAGTEPTECYSTISSTARWPWRAAELASKARIA